MPLTMGLNNADLTTIKLLKLIGSTATNEEITRELRIHPEYPTLLSINDVLNNFGANAAAYRVTKNDFDQIPCPFIAHTNENGEEYLTVEKVTGDTLHIYGRKNKQKKITVDDFKKIADGIVLVPENGNTRGAQTSKVGFSFESMRYPVAIFLGIFIIISGLTILTTSLTNWQTALALTFKTVGIVATVLLLIQSIDQNNAMVQALCGGGKTNCNAILTSNAAYVVDGLSWSEVGFFYFAGTWLTLLFAGAEAGILSIVAILNIISLPYTFYSIYYQARVAKQWCVFCCTVQAVLWLEFIPLLPALNHHFISPSLNAILVMLICLALPAMVWLLIKPLIIQLQKSVSLENQLRSFKYNAASFNTLLKSQPKYSSPNEDWCITMGNTEAGNIITMVSNPYCPPCSKVHGLLDDWLERNLDIQLRLVFTAANHENDPKTPVARHFMALNELEDKAVVKKALNDWYLQKKKNYNEWAKAYPIAFNESKFYKLNKQYEWCRMADIKATPTILINGYRLPDTYQLEDIKYLLAEQ